MTAGTRSIKFPFRRPSRILSSLAKAFEGGLGLDMGESVVLDTNLGLNSVSVSIERSGKLLLDEVEGLAAIQE